MIHIPSKKSEEGKRPAEQTTARTGSIKRARARDTRIRQPPLKFRVCRPIISSLKPRPWVGARDTSVQPGLRRTKKQTPKMKDKQHAQDMGRAGRKRTERILRARESAASAPMDCKST